MKTTLIKKISTAAFAFALVATALFVPALPASAQLQEGIDASRGEISEGQPVPDTLFGGSDSIFTTIVNFLLLIIGAISVIMLIYGGIRYTTSGGNSASVTAAKNTILYAIIGLLVAFLAFAIINFVLRGVTNSL